MTQGMLPVLSRKPQSKDDADGALLEPGTVQAQGEREPAADVSGPGHHFLEPWGKS